MPNHWHLVVEIAEKTLADGMQRLAGEHAQRFNRRHEVDGHLFQGRYWAKMVRSDTQFAQLLRYVALNPVAAGLCADPSEWRWSSHRATLNGWPAATRARKRVEELLEVWSGDAGDRYARLFDPSGSLALSYGMDSPWEHRPPLAELLASGSLDEGMRLARDHGYRLAEIAKAVGLHESTVSRRARRAS
jgi:hypothetical protein